MTSAVFTRGWRWSKDHLTNGWGDNVSDEQAQRLGALVVERFNNLASANGSTCWWRPETSEVIYTVVGDGPNKFHERRDDGKQTSLADVQEWMELATLAIWEAVIGDSNDAEITVSVAEVLTD